MRILFISDNFPPESNAPANRTHEHLREWVRNGHSVTVITGVPNFPQGQVHDGYRNRLFQRETIDGIEVKRVWTYIAPNEGFVRRIVDYLSFMCMAFLTSVFQPRPDVIIATSPQFFSAVCGWAVARIRRRPLVLEIRDMWPSSIVAVGVMRDSFFIRIMSRIEAFLYRSADSIVVVTHSFKQEMIESGIDGSKISVILNGVDRALFSATESDIRAVRDRHSLGNRLVVGYIGTHGLAHDLGTVLEAARKLADDSRIHFIFVGAGAERGNVEREVDERQMRNVTLIPQQPRKAIPAILGACDLCLVPLRDSPVFAGVIPSKIFECQAMGVPIIMSLPEGEATAIVRENQCGFTIAPERPDLLAAAIAELADDDAQRAELSTCASAAAKRYSRRAMAELMLQTVQRTANGYGN